MRLHYLDELKAFAIIAVVLYHSGFMPFGYLGVDVFLVINGFLITKSLAKHYLNGGSLEEDRGSCWRIYYDFILHRFARLLPVLLVAEIVCLVLGFFAMLPDDFENLSESVIATNIFGNNILAAITTRDYWDVANVYKPLMHTWYVGLVMQFYLVYPFLFFFARLSGKDCRRRLITIVSVLAIVSLFIYLGIGNDAHRFYYLPSRFFEFAVGGLVALVFFGKKNEGSFHPVFVYICYAIVLVLMAVNYDIVPKSLRLLMVVASSIVLIMSGSVLENRIAANSVLSKIGSASYSIFVWHQVVLAFYRYSCSSHYSFLSYLFVLGIISILSWFTFHFIERQTGNWLNQENKRKPFVLITFVTWLGLIVFAGFVYLREGVVRDVPELGIVNGEIADHRYYVDRIYQLDKPFETAKPHWLIVGNSFGRDFANVVLESAISDSVEVSYVFSLDYNKPQYSERFSTADRVFFCSLGATEETVRDVEMVCLANGLRANDLIVVGTKNFGDSNGQVYIKRNDPDYFSLRAKVSKDYLELNSRMKDKYGSRYLDLMGLVLDENGTVPVFTPNHLFICRDGRHFTKGGAVWYSRLITWDPYLSF